MLYCLSLSLLVFVQTKKPSDKDQQAVWRLECELGVISDAECPVDGGWAPWSPWSECSGRCDEMGLRRRVRECNNPSPTPEGLPCTGADHQSEPCYLSNCKIDDYRKLVQSDSIRKEALKLLEAVPSLTERCLKIECPYEAVEATLENDNTWQFSPESLWNALQCVKHNLGCLIVGEWGPWGEWSTCGARCGYGMRWRLRKCDMPPPSSALLICSGTPLQVDECQGDQCAVRKRGSGGNWSKWGPWSVCSENCGIGVRRRKRTCLETNTPRIFGSWGTHCRGQYDQIEVCKNKECILNGGWSGWGAWGPCSRTCGAGRRARYRSCTRPEPAGGGKFCIGPRTEMGSCHLKPCQTFPRTVALFNGESSLTYDFNKRFTFFHFYARFLPLSPHGSLVRRGAVHNTLVRLSLQKWHICLDASGLSRSCTVSRLCSRDALEPAKWHSVLITVTNVGTTMKLNDKPDHLRNTFSCDPELPNDNVRIVVGERLHGELQELILNFIPLCMELTCDGKCKSGYCPRSGSNIAYDSSAASESYVVLDNDHYLRLPCFSNPDEWQIKLTMKPVAESGVILFMLNQNAPAWLLVQVQNMRFVLKLVVKDFLAESVSSVDYPPGQWLDAVVSKSKDTNVFELLLNGVECLHVVYQDIEEYVIEGEQPSLKTRDNGNETDLVVCSHEYFIGGIPDDVKTNFATEILMPMSGVIASLAVNNELLDLNEISMERYKDNVVQLSSRTASVSGSYFETAWGTSNRLNLTCLHTRSARSPNAASWLYLDSEISGVWKDKRVRSVDDGKILKLVANTNNDIRGFYTCRSHRAKRHKNIVTYGVLGQMSYKLSGPDLTTTIAVITTIALVLGTLICLFIEGIHDIRNGYGFFRDAHFTPEEEAETICDYIDQNMHLMANEHAADLAKERARRIGQQMAYETSSILEKPENFLMTDSLCDDSVPSELEELPALPEIRSSNMDLRHQALRCEQSYVSSPQHGSALSPKSRLTSSTSPAELSPRILCPRLALGKRMMISKSAVRYRKRKISKWPVTQMSEPLTIKSSMHATQPLAQKVLQRFEDLKSNDASSP